ncbi:MAG: hypothetical protein ACPGJS_23540 [Flammeovirgaceae bacterium]
MKKNKLSILDDEKDLTLVKSVDDFAIMGYVDAENDLMKTKANAQPKKGFFAQLFGGKKQEIIDQKDLEKTELVEEYQKQVLNELVENKLDAMSQKFHEVMSEARLKDQEKAAITQSAAFTSLLYELDKAQATFSERHKQKMKALEQLEDVDLKEKAKARLMQQAEQFDQFLELQCRDFLKNMRRAKRRGKFLQ